MYLEVEENPNCEDSVSMRFKELGPPQRVKQVKIEGHGKGSEAGKKLAVKVSGS